VDLGLAPDAHAWVDGELSLPAARAFAEHLRACGPCRTHVADLTRFLRTVRAGARRAAEPAPARLRALVRTLAAGPADGAVRPAGPG
jgi:anti-sigma factor RsiW